MEGTVRNVGTLRIKGGRVIDPSTGLDGTTDVWIKDGRIAGTGDSAPEGWPGGSGAGASADETIEAAGLIVCPGLIDIHVHFREPGNEEDETIATGSAAALAGGVTTVCCMPNTIPAIDSAGMAEFVILQGRRARRANVFPVGAVSKGRKGEELAELGQLAAAGAVAFTDDGSPVANAELMRRALEYSAMFDKVIMQHCQVPELTVGAVMNEGSTSLRLGLPGWPPAAEDIMVARDIRLAEITGGRVHMQHLSTARSVELVREGKRRGARVTAEACPHHFTLTDECLTTFDSNFKMNPPLRTRADVEAILEGLRDGTIDAIATDHAPHAPEKKARSIDQAPFGIVGLETLLPISIKALIEPGVLTWPEMIAKLTWTPAKLLGLTGKGTFAAGADGDATLIDPDAEWTIDPSRFLSKSRNTPYGGWNVRGRAAATIVAGEVRHRWSGTA